MSQRRFADQHTALVIFMKNLIDLIDLCIDLIRPCIVFAADKSKRVFSALQHILHIGRYHGFRNVGAYDRLHAEAVVDAVDIIDLIQQFLLILGRCIFINQEHMKGAASEIIFHLLRCLFGRKRSRKRAGHIIVNADIVIAVDRRNKHHGKNNQPDRKMLCDEIRRLFQVVQQCSVRGLCDQLVAAENQ